VKLKRLAIVALLALGLGAAPARATVPGENGKIAFTSRADSPYGDIHTVTPSPDPSQRNETNLTPNPWWDQQPAWSPDGSKIAYVSRTTENGPDRIWVMNEDGSDKAQLTDDPNPAFLDFSPTWSPDGTQIAWVAHRATTGLGGVYVMDSDGANPHRVVGFAGLQDVDWSPDGTKFAFSASGGATYVANSDGSGGPSLVTGFGDMPSWSPSQNWIVYAQNNFIARATPDGAFFGPVQGSGWAPDWSPDGRYIVRRGGFSSEIIVREEGAAAGGFAVADNGNDPDWQARPPFVTPPGYPRPRGAGPLDVSLVPAYQSCDAPNTTHGAPLSFGSCVPPAATSTTLTTGTPDANGQAARFAGRFTLKPIVGNPFTPEDEADVRLTVSVSDVRCQSGATPGCDPGTLGDYGGTLRAVFDLMITDHDNGGSAAESATVKTIPYYQPALHIDVECVRTADPAVGSTCAMDTTADAIAGNVTPEFKRSTWALGQVQLWDRGEDGNPNSDDNTLFAVQGVFVP
jgi:Tol biopolymer transport system component